LLKIPAFGIFRILTTTPTVGVHETIVFIILLVFSIVAALYSTFQEFDLKRIVALSSIVHMNVYVLLLFLIGGTSTASIFIYFLIVHTFTAGLLFFVFGMLIERVHTRNYKTILGVLSSTPRLKTLILISAFFYGALPISGIFSLELTLTQVVSYRLGYAAAGVALLSLSAVFIKILIVISQLNSQHYIQKFSPADVGVADMILCFTIFIVLICLLMLNSMLVNIFLECSCYTSRHKSHSIKLPLKLKRIFTRRGYRLSHKDPQEPERD
jgi:formate hydrogenlyase subunit 3/multisubunit Na+/H+ antiporter MnhD subunit